MERRAASLPFAAVARAAAMFGLLTTLAVGAPAGAAEAPAKPPVATSRPVENRYFGSVVRDEYQWLEDWSDPAVKSWVEAQNKYTRGVLDQIATRGAIRDRVAELSRDISPDYASLEYRGGTLFALKDQPP